MKHFTLSFHFCLVQHFCQMVFSDNLARFIGLDIFIQNLAFCAESTLKKFNFVMANVKYIKRSGNSNSTLADKSLHKRMMAYVSTGTSYLFFYGASPPCVKKVLGHSYVLPQCLQETVKAM